MRALRKGARGAGKSDPIDALAIARAALAEGPDRLPEASVDEQALEIKLLLDHHDDLVAARSDDQRRLRWHLHDMWPELELPAGCLDREIWLQRALKAPGSGRAEHPGAGARARTGRAGQLQGSAVARAARLRRADRRQGPWRGRRHHPLSGFVSPRKPRGSPQADPAAQSSRFASRLPSRSVPGRIPPSGSPRI